MLVFTFMLLLCWGAATGIYFQGAGKKEIKKPSPLRLLEDDRVHTIDELRRAFPDTESDDFKIFSDALEAACGLSTNANGFHDLPDDFGRAEWAWRWEEDLNKARALFTERPLVPPKNLTTGRTQHITCSHCGSAGVFQTRPGDYYNPTGWKCDACKTKMMREIKKEFHSKELDRYRSRAYIGEVGVPSEGAVDCPECDRKIEKYGSHRHGSTTFQNMKGRVYNNGTYTKPEPVWVKDPYACDTFRCKRHGHEFSRQFIEDNSRWANQCLLCEILKSSPVESANQSWDRLLAHYNKGHVSSQTITSKTYK